MRCGDAGTARATPCPHPTPPGGYGARSGGGSRSRGGSLVEPPGSSGRGCERREQPLDLTTLPRDVVTHRLDRAGLLGGVDEPPESERRELLGEAVLADLAGADLGRQTHDVGVVAAGVA